MIVSSGKNTAIAIGVLVKEHNEKERSWDKPQFGRIVRGRDVSLIGRLVLAAGSLVLLTTVLPKLKAALCSLDLPFMPLRRTSKACGRAKSRQEGISTNNFKQLRSARYILKVRHLLCG